MRKDKRKNEQLRAVKIQRNYIRNADGSVLISCGNTKVICTASVQEKVPPHVRNTGSGWVSAEYAMLPCSSSTRIDRERTRLGGRTQEIQRLIGRSLRAVVDMKEMGERSIIIDCDVVQADGGTRTAAISGAFVALVDALRKMKKEKRIKRIPVRDYLGAVSVGIVEGKAMLDLAYDEDVSAEVDMNVVMTGKGEFVEVQATGEKSSFSEKQLSDLLSLAKCGITEIIKRQKKLLGRL